MFSFFGYFNEKPEQKPQPLEKVDVSQLDHYIKTKCGVKMVFDGFERVEILDSKETVKDVKAPEQVQPLTFVILDRGNSLTVYWNDNSIVCDKDLSKEKSNELRMLLPRAKESSEDPVLLKQIKFACLPFDIKHFYTPLDIGKYKLSLWISFWLEQALEKSIDQDVLKKLYLAYKINEFLEHDSFGALNPPLKTTLSHRKDFNELLTESSVVGIETFVDRERNRIVERFQNMFRGLVELPDIPSYLSTGSGYYGCYSQLHYIIKNLADQCQQKMAYDKALLDEPLEQNKKSLKM